MLQPYVAKSVLWLKNPTPPFLAMPHNDYTVEAGSCSSCEGAINDHSVDFGRMEQVHLRASLQAYSTNKEREK
jgi:hypothetical protein